MYQQRKAVEIKDGVKGEDQGGHLIARIFNGPGEQISDIPQNAKLNQHTPTQASGYVVLIRWLQSALIPFVTTQSVGVLNPPYE